ncbi:hypothetical protein [Helicobacter ganmani]
MIIFIIRGYGVLLVFARRRAIFCYCEIPKGIVAINNLELITARNSSL